jgi:hypothetical protein
MRCCGLFLCFFSFTGVLMTEAFWESESNFDGQNAWPSNIFLGCSDSVCTFEEYWVVII